MIQETFNKLEQAPDDTTLLIVAEPGSGKTFHAGRFIAAHLDQSFLYFAPTHKVCDEIARALRAQGVKVKHLKGREFEEEGIPYCLRLEEVKEIQQKYFASAEMICADCEFNCLRKGHDPEKESCLYKAQFKKDDSNCIITVPQYLQTKTLRAKFDEFDYMIIDDGYDVQKTLQYSISDISELGRFILDLHDRHQLDEVDRLGRFGNYTISQIIGHWLIALGNQVRWTQAYSSSLLAATLAESKEEFKELLFNQSPEQIDLDREIKSLFSEQDVLVGAIWHISEQIKCDLNQITDFLKSEVTDYILPGENYVGSDRAKKPIFKLLEQYIEFQWRHHYKESRKGNERALKLPKLILDRMIELIFQVTHSWNAPEVFTNIQLEKIEEDGFKDSFEKCFLPKFKKAVILDGTPDIKYYKRHFPDLEVQEIPVESESNSVIYQFVNGKFGKKQLSNPATRNRLFKMIKEVIKGDCRDLLEAGAKFLITGSLTFMKDDDKSIKTFLFEDPLLSTRRDQFAFVHFNSVRSSNEFKDYHVLIHFGEINPSWKDTEDYVRTFYPYEPAIEKIKTNESGLRNAAIIEEEEIPVRSVKKNRKFLSLILGSGFQGDWASLKNREIVHDSEYLDPRVQGFVDKIRNAELAQLIYRIRPSEMAELEGDKVKKRIFIFNSRQIPGILPHVVMRRERATAKAKYNRVVRALEQFGSGATVEMIAKVTSLNPRTVRYYLRNLESAKLITQIDPSPEVLEEHRKIQHWTSSRGRIPRAFRIIKQFHETEQAFKGIYKVLQDRNSELDGSLRKWKEVCRYADSPFYTLGREFNGALPPLGSPDRELLSSNLAKYQNAVMAVEGIIRKRQLSESLIPQAISDLKEILPDAAFISELLEPKLFDPRDPVSWLNPYTFIDPGVYNFYFTFCKKKRGGIKELAEALLWEEKISDRDFILLLVERDIRIYDLLFDKEPGSAILLDEFATRFPSILKPKDLKEFLQRDPPPFKSYLKKILDHDIAPKHLRKSLKALLESDPAPIEDFAEILYFLAGVNQLVLDKMR